MTHLEKELELNSVEATDELQMNTITQNLQPEDNEVKSGNNNTDKNSSNHNNNINDRKLETVCLHCGTCGNTKHPTEKCHYGTNAANSPLPSKIKPARQNRNQVQDEQNNIFENVQAPA